MGNRNRSAALSEGGSERVRENTSAEVNARLDREMRERVEAYAATGGRRWLVVPGFVPPLVLLHAVQGGCQPVPLFRRLGVRTRMETERERCVLKAPRGDFEGVTTVSGEGGAAVAVWALEAVETLRVRESDETIRRIGKRSAS